MEIRAEVVMFILVCSIAAFNFPTAKHNVDFNDRRDFKLAAVGLLADKNYSHQDKFWNRLFAAGGHMVQNPPCWRASYALGHPQQRRCKFVLMKSLCSGCPSGQLALQHGGFCTM